MPVQLQYIQLIMNKTNAAHLSSGAFASLVSVTWTNKIHKKVQQSWRTSALAMHLPLAS